MKLYHTETQEDYDALMIILEEKGRKWICGNEPTFFKFWKTYKESTCIIISDKGITFGNIEQYKKQYPDTPIIEYKAKGEDMTQEEMKQKLQVVAKLQEVAFDISASIESFARGTLAVEADLKEAKTSAKKLIEKIDEYLESQEPEFKVGDYVTVDVNDRKITAKIDELRDNKKEVHGLWYDKTRVNVKKDYWFLTERDKFRHATDREIVEYEVALTFHKHGRKPFEVKDGDLLENKFGKFIAYKSLFVKENFTVEGNAFLKAVEEVNEWLENK